MKQVVSEIPAKKEILEKAWCNKCGKEFSSDDVVYQHFADIIIKWGFGSPKDGDQEEFKLCEPCYDEIISEFKIPVKRTRLW